MMESGERGRERETKRYLDLDTLDLLLSTEDGATNKGGEGGVGEVSASKTALDKLIRKKKSTNNTRENSAPVQFTIIKRESIKRHTPVPLSHTMTLVSPMVVLRWKKEGKKRKLAKLKKF